MKEDALAQYIVNYLESKGYECYKEVCLKGKGGNIRSDCYAVQKINNEIVMSLALETKLTFSLKVMQQAFSWKKYAHTVYIGIPYAKRKTKLNDFALEICQHFGIGVFEVTKQGQVYHTLVAEQKNKKVTHPPLYEQQKSSIAGTSTGQFYTSYKNTLNLIAEFMADKADWIDIKDLILGVKHHYKNTTSAKATLVKYINNGIIQGYELDIDDKTVKIKRVSSH